MTQNTFTEVRTVYVQQEGLTNPPWFANPLASAKALCTYNTGGDVNVVISPFYIADTLCTAITLQISGLPTMKFDEANIHPSFPGLQFLSVPFVGAIINGSLSNIAATGVQEVGGPFVLDLWDNTYQTKFAPNSEVYIMEQSDTYKWASIPGFKF